MITTLPAAPVWPAWLRFVMVLLMLFLLDSAWSWGLLQGSVIAASYASGAASASLMIDLLFLAGWLSGVALNVCLLVWATRQGHKAAVFAGLVSIPWLTGACLYLYILTLFGNFIGAIFEAIPPH